MLKVWLILFQVLSLKAAPLVLTQTVGTSAFQVVTSREVQAMELVAQALEGETKTPLIELSGNAANRTLYEIAIYREAQSLAAIKEDPEVIAKLVASVQKRLQKKPEWKKLHVSESELKSWIERKKVASDYMKLKANSLTGIITDQEIQDYYTQNRVKFGSTPLEAQRDNIRLFLQKQSQKQRVREWMTALKSKYQI